MYAARPQAWHVKHALVNASDLEEGRSLSFFVLLKPGTRVKMSIVKRKGKVITAPPSEGHHPPGSLDLMGHQHSPWTKETTEMPRGCSVLLETKQRGRKRGRIRGGKLRKPIHQLGVTLTSGNVSEPNWNLPITCYRQE